MNYFQHYLVDEFAEDYQEGHITRREALKLIAGVTGSILLADLILAGCTPAAEAVATMTSTSITGPAIPSLTATADQPTPAATMGAAKPASDLAIEAADIQFSGNDTTILAHLARPTGEGPFPVVLVCHENRGLTAHIKDVADRFAIAGYVTLAVDLLSRQGGTGALTPDQVPGALGNTPPDQFVQDFLDGWRYLQTQPFARADRVGMVGFCFGGGVTWLMATRMPELRAAVPFYGPNPPLEDVPKIQAAVLAMYGALDQRIDQGIPAIERAMTDNHKVFEKVVYPNADHAFFNDTGTRYNPQAAQDAWIRTLDWFRKYLDQ
jgi:carboxymethylenebutenolidase